MTHLTTNNNIMYLLEAIQQVRRRKKQKEQKESLKKATKSDMESTACSQKSHVPHTNSSMYFFL